MRVLLVLLALPAIALAQPYTSIWNAADSNGCYMFMSLAKVAGYDAKLNDPNYRGTCFLPTDQAVTRAILELNTTVFSVLQDKESCARIVRAHLAEKPVYPPVGTAPVDDVTVPCVDASPVVLMKRCALFNRCGHRVRTWDNRIGNVIKGDLRCGASSVAYLVDTMCKPKPYALSPSPAPSPKPGCICPLVYMPVCGADGKTYGNACEAACANVAVVKNGACQAVVPATPSPAKASPAPQPSPVYTIPAASPAPVYSPDNKPGNGMGNGVNNKGNGNRFGNAAFTLRYFLQSPSPASGASPVYFAASPAPAGTSPSPDDKGGRVNSPSPAAGASPVYFTASPAPAGNSPSPDDKGGRVNSPSPASGASPVYFTTSPAPAGSSPSPDDKGGRVNSPSPAAGASPVYFTASPAPAGNSPSPDDKGGRVNSPSPASGASPVYFTTSPAPAGNSPSPDDKGGRVNSPSPAAGASPVYFTASPAPAGNSPSPDDKGGRVNSPSPAAGASPVYFTASPAPAGSSPSPDDKGGRVNSPSPAQQASPVYMPAASPVPASPAPKASPSPAPSPSKFSFSLCKPALVAIKELPMLNISASIIESVPELANYMRNLNPAIPFTCMAPANSAWYTLAGQLNTTVDGLKACPNRMADIIKSHIILDNVVAPDTVADNSYMRTYSNWRVVFKRTGATVSVSGEQYPNDCQVIFPRNVACCRGRVNVIDRVIMPYPPASKC